MIKDYMKEVEPVFISDPKLLQQREKLYRFDNSVSRYYFRFPDFGEEIAYLGATGATDKLLPTGKGLMYYYGKNGELTDLMVKSLAEYGTLMHVTIGDIEKNGGVCDFDSIADLASRHAVDSGFPFEMTRWAYHLPRNVASWLQFRKDHNVRVLAVEFPVWSDTFSIATLSDIYCEIDFNKKRVLAVINLKKGSFDADDDENKKFYESHDLQLQIEKLLWEECYPQQPVEMVFNWSPNNWTEKPTYTLKNWTEKTQFSKAVLTGHMLPMLRMIPGYFAPPRKVATLFGKYEGGDLQNNINMVRMAAPK